MTRPTGRILDGSSKGMLIAPLRNPPPLLYCVNCLMISRIAWMLVGDRRLLLRF